MRVTPADVLTIFRLVLTPVFLALFVIGQDGWALTVFCVAGATDLIDGTVARLTKSPSKMGALLDPIADKALIQTCFISLGVAKILPFWFVLFALARDLMIVTGIIYLTKTKVELPLRAIVVSKIATFSMLLVAALGLAVKMDPGLAFMGLRLSVWLIYAVIVTSALILVSGVKYMMLGFEILRRRRMHDERYNSR